MDVSFVETMRGTLVGADGDETSIEFDVKAYAPRLGWFLRDGATTLAGVVRLPPYAREAPAKGTLTLGLRALEYVLDFRGDDGTRYTLRGVKHPTPRAPVRSMTEMPVRLLGTEGRELATGVMRFDNRELFAFLATWIPIGRRSQRALDARRRVLERRWLDGILPRRDVAR